FDFVMDYDFLNFLNHSLHSIIKIIVQTITRRVAAGWLVLPFQGERITVTHKRKTLPKDVIYRIITATK
ncbi:MAG: hypothetical protein LBG58_12355, partial [Planctomycetaceae bacterium]|nr:hypothetical protein [Planctomycetaceae bacterium]